MKARLSKLIMTALAISAAFVIVPGIAEAHHGWADFEEAKEVTFQGTVVAFHYTNPHCVVEFEVTDDKGKVKKWEGEFASPGELQRKGWNPNSLESGDKLTITGHPSKDGSPAIHVSKIAVNGKELQLEKYSR
jgi:hypothetical protein